MDVQTKREREKKLVSQMIALYCKKSTAPGTVFVRSALPWRPMPVSGVKNVPLWRRRLFAPTARYIATKRICGRKSGR